MKAPWHPLIGDPDSVPDDSLDKPHTSSDSQVAGLSGDARLPTAPPVSSGAGERATLIGERWFEDEPAFLQQPETSRANIDQPAKPIIVKPKRKTVRSLAVAVLRAVLASLEKDH